MFQPVWKLALLWYLCDHYGSEGGQWKYAGILLIHCGVKITCYHCVCKLGIFKVAKHILKKMTRYYCPSCFFDGTQWFPKHFRGLRGCCWQWLEAVGGTRGQAYSPALWPCQFFHVASGKSRVLLNSPLQEDEDAILKLRFAAWVPEEPAWETVEKYSKCFLWAQRIRSLHKYYQSACAVIGTSSGLKQCLPI